MLTDMIKRFSDDIKVNTCSLSAFRPYTKCYSLLALSFTKHSKNILQKSYKIGNDHKDTNTISKIKGILERLTGRFLFNIDDLLNAEPEVNIFSNVEVKLIMLGDEPLAIGNLEETKFLLINEKNFEFQKIISKEELDAEINKILTYRANAILKEFSNNVEEFNSFLSNYKSYISDISDTYIADFEIVLALMKN